MKHKIFCDESNHLEHDKTNILVLGAMHCDTDEVIKVNKHIKYIRHKHTTTTNSNGQN